MYIVPACPPQLHLFARIWIKQELGAASRLATLTTLHKPTVMGHHWLTFQQCFSQTILDVLLWREHVTQYNILSSAVMLILLNVLQTALRVLKTLKQLKVHDMNYCSNI